MLKHVHFSTSSLASYRCKTPTRDTVSLSSTLSLGSSGVHEPVSSLFSSTSSLQVSSKLSPSPKVMLKIYTRVLCADMEYKTLCITPETTSKEVVRVLLNKFRMKHRDPNLFYLTMEVWMRKTGMPIRSVMVLDDESRPAELQACHPRGESKNLTSSRPLCRFKLQMRRGGLVKIYDGCLMAESLYKSLLVSDKTTVEEVIQLVLHCCNSNERPSLFSLYELSASDHHERKLYPQEFPLVIQYKWPDPKQFAFHLRRNTAIYPIRRWYYLIFRKTWKQNPLIVLDYLYDVYKRLNLIQKQLLWTRFIHIRRNTISKPSGLDYVSHGKKSTNYARPS